MNSFLLLALLCFTLGPINISIGLIKEFWFNIILGITCSIIGIYDLYTILEKLI